MPPLVYVDTSEVHEGAVERVEEAIRALADFVEANEPQLVAYSAYLSDDGRRMKVVHVHADAASLDRHMELAGPRFAPFADLLTLSSIEIYGEPSEKAREELQRKLRLLGAGDVRTYRPHAGFVRFDAQPSGRR